MNKQIRVNIVCFLLIVLCSGCLARDGGETSSSEPPPSVPQPPVTNEFDPGQAAVGLIEFISDKKVLDIYPISGLDDTILMSVLPEGKTYADRVQEYVLYQGPDAITSLFITDRFHITAGVDQDGQILLLSTSYEEGRLFRYDLKTQVLEDEELSLPVLASGAVAILDAKGERIVWEGEDSNLYIADLSDLAGYRVLWPEGPESAPSRATWSQWSETGEFLSFGIAHAGYQSERVLYHLETGRVMRTQQLDTYVESPPLVGDKVYLITYEDDKRGAYEHVKIMDMEGIREVRLETPYRWSYGGSNGLLVLDEGDNLYVYNEDLSQHQLVYKGTNGVYVTNCFSTNTRIYVMLNHPYHAAYLLTLEHPYAVERQKETP